MQRLQSALLNALCTCRKAPHAILAESKLWCKRTWLTMRGLESLSLVSAILFFSTLMLTVLRLGAANQSNVALAQQTVPTALPTLVATLTQQRPTATLVPTPTALRPRIIQTPTASFTPTPTKPPHKTLTPTQTPSPTGTPTASQHPPTQMDADPTSTPTDAIIIAIPPCMDWLLEVTDENYVSLQTCYRLMYGEPPEPGAPLFCPPPKSPWIMYPAFQDDECLVPNASPPTLTATPAAYPEP